MNILNFWQRHPKNKTYHRRWLIRAVAALLTCLLILAIGVTSYADVPSAALIVRFRGNGLNVRSGTNRNVIPVRSGQRNVLENSNDVLYVPGDNRSKASFALAVTQVWEYGGLLINTTPSNMPSQYTFPCRFGGRLTIGWRPQGGNRDRACNQGATVGPVRGQNALLPLQGNPNLAQAAKEILKAQANEEVLVVPSDDETVIKTADTGNGITVDVVEGDVNIKSAKNPQGRPVKAGERYSYPQDTITPINRNDLINSPEIQDFLNPDNWLSPEVPPRMANGIAEQLGQHRVALGSPTQPVVSTPRIPATEPSTAFNTTTPTSQTERTPTPSARGNGRCGQQQVSGGQAGDVRKIQLSRASGKVYIAYNMCSVPDTLVVYYEGNKLLEKNLSGSGLDELEIGGTSTELTVEVIGNPNESTTRWGYILSCPDDSKVPQAPAICLNSNEPSVIERIQDGIRDRIPIPRLPF